MNELFKQETPLEEARLAENVVQGILKAKKMMRMYPPNNPLYINASEAIYNKFKKFFEVTSMLSLKVLQNELIFSNERVYYNPEKVDNLALFFFKDGIREITFENGITQEELEDFIKILTMDFDRDTLDDDVVTLLWEKNFEHIRYIVNENFLIDEDVDSTYKVYEDIKENVYSDDSLKTAYNDALQTEATQADIPCPIDEADIQYIYNEIKQQDRPKTDKLITILSELLYEAKELTTFKEITGLFENALEYCLSNVDFKNAAYLLELLKEAIEKRTFGAEGVKSLGQAYNSINKESCINEIGRILNTKLIIDEEGFTKYIRHMDKSALPYFVQLMGEIENLKGRHLIIGALTILGRLDMKTLAEGLNDKRWEVVRDTIHILGRIGTSGSLEYLALIVSHPDEKIRKEALRTIGNIKHPNAFQYLKLALSDRAESVRTIAARAISNIKTESAKKVLLVELQKKDFASRDFNEKKEFFAAMAHWSDQDVKNFLIKTLKKKKLWNKKKNDETRACAAYALGIIRATESLPLLEKISSGNNKLLKEYSVSAIKRLKGRDV